MRRDGMGYSEIAEAMGVSRQLAYDMCKRAACRELREADPLYAALIGAAERTGHSARTATMAYNALRLRGLRTLEKLSGRTEWELRRVRNVGEAGIEIIKEAVR